VGTNNGASTPTYLIQTTDAIVVMQAWTGFASADSRGSPLMDSPIGPAERTSHNRAGRVLARARQGAAVRAEGQGAHRRGVPEQGPAAGPPGRLDHHAKRRMARDYRRADRFGINPL
jgi:hypothetical protein